MAQRLVLLAVAPLALVLGLAVVLIGNDCPDGTSANPGTLSREAERAIPRDIADIYVTLGYLLVAWLLFVKRRPLLA